MFDFPNTPTVNQQVTTPNGTFQWDGVKWAPFNAGTGAGVTSFNTRIGAVTLTAADIIGAGGALLASPIFTGTPQAPTMAPGNNSTAIATTAFVVATGGGGIKSVHIQRFTAAGAFTYTPTVGMTFCIVEAVGGGGGAALATGAAAALTSSPGGGGGAYVRKLLTAAQVGTSLTGNVGGGGSAGATGGTSSLAALVSAVGGGGSIGGTTGTLGSPGAGGEAGSSVGDVTISGSNGGYGAWASTLSGGNYAFSGGAGGASVMGPVTFAIATTSGSTVTGSSGTGAGSGAAGGCVYNNATSAGGASGGGGIVIVTEFCTQ